MVTIYFLISEGLQCHPSLYTHGNVCAAEPRTSRQQRIRSFYPSSILVVLVSSCTFDDYSNTVIVTSLTVDTIAPTLLDVTRRTFRCCPTVAKHFRSIPLILPGGPQFFGVFLIVSDWVLVQYERSDQSFLNRIRLRSCHEQHRCCLPHYS